MGMQGITRVLLGVGALAALAAPSAQARDFSCDASAIRLQLASAATVEPITANRGQTTCKEVKSQTSATSGPVSGGILLAQTTVPSASQADATGGLGQLTVGLGALTGLPIPTLDAINSIQALSVPVPAATQLLFPTLPSTI